MFAVKLLWRAAECWKESLNLLNIAEDAYLKLASKGERETPLNCETQIVRRKYVLFPGLYFLFCHSHVEYD